MPVFSPRLSQQRMKLRPMRPNPLIATFSVMASSGKAASKVVLAVDHTEMIAGLPRTRGLPPTRKGLSMGATNLAA
jgi:hypothetical protein